ncbi:reverse transcriptase [Senna tora]|uniref:Reverse transcriptase n=1 Tax=Senna tora TaxID=362788 RepID=A0A834XID2_9FABA|nr:reverse transcriptase [Senna tora]
MLESGNLEYQVKCDPTFVWDSAREPDQNDAESSSNDQQLSGHNSPKDFNLMDPLHMFAWNARGAAGSAFKRVFADMMQRYKPNLVLVTETRVAGDKATEIINGLGFNNHFMVNPMGYAGGMWLLWNEDQVKVTVLDHTFQEIHTRVEVNNSSPIFVSCVYASPLRERRKILWGNLIKLAPEINMPWIIGGDFNEVLSQDEKWGLRPASNARIREFKHCIDSCGLVDLGYSGQKFTWCNKRPAGDLVYCRLDRFLANGEWLNRYLESANSHLPRIKSDHCPIFLSSSPVANVKSDRPFRCERFWVNHPDFVSLTKEVWKLDAEISINLISLKQKAIKWNKDTFGNIFVEKNNLFKRIEGLYRHKGDRPDHQFQILEKKLITDYQSLLAIEEDFWAAKSRMDWLKLGDSNTKFFHNSVLINRRRNRISGLKDSAGNWISNVDDLNKLITTHFKELFKAETCASIPNCFTPSTINRIDKERLSEIPNYIEIKNALWELKPFKAPGVDGFQPGFYQKCWEVLDKNVVEEGPLPLEEEGISVASVLNAKEGDSNNNISFILTDVIRQGMNTIMIKRNNIADDVIAWKGNTSGKFSLKSAYFLILNEGNNMDNIAVNPCSFSWIWKLDCHNRKKFFIWRLSHHGIPCRDLLKSRGILIHNGCPMCETEAETVDHIFKNCHKTKEIWKEALNHFKPLSEPDFLKWVQINSKDPSISSPLNIPNGTLFIYLLWQIWSVRNKKVFENLYLPPKIAFQNALAKAVEFIHLSKTGSPNSAMIYVDLCWSPPPEGFYKLNVDGSCMGNPGLMAAAGVIRDHLGHWISGFSKFIGPGCSLAAELWGLFLGLKLAKDIGIKNLMVETDCAAVSNLINCNDTPITHHFLPLIIECRSFLPQFDHCRIAHAHREKNKCADLLAKNAVVSRSPFDTFDTVPIDLFLVFWADLMGITSSRRCRGTFDPG